MPPTSMADPDRETRMMSPSATPTGSSIPGGHPSPRGQGGVPPMLGAYRILGPLGAGGMGMVFEAVDDELQRPAAIKIVSPRGALSADAVARLRIEAQSAARLNHPNIVTVYAFGYEDDLAYIAMERLEGLSLTDVLRSRGKLPPEEALRLMRTAAVALDFALQRGVIHRDLKPSNLFLTDTGNLKILDFGLAKRLDDEAGLTQTAEVMGSPHYMAPEQARGEKVDHRADMYALGMTLYHLVVGHPPYKDASPTQAILRHQSDPVPVTPELDAMLGGRLWPIIDRLAAKKREQRPADYPTLIALMDGALEGTPAPTRPAAATVRMAAAPSRSRVPLIAGAVVAAVVMAGAAWHFTGGSPAPPRLPAALPMPTAAPTPAPLRANPPVPETAEAPAFGDAPPGGPPQESVDGGTRPQGPGSAGQRRFSGGPRGNEQPPGPDPARLRDAFFAMSRFGVAVETISREATAGRFVKAIEALPRRNDTRVPPPAWNALGHVSDGLRSAEFARAAVDPAGTMQGAALADRMAAVGLGSVAEGPVKLGCAMGLAAMNDPRSEQVWSAWVAANPKDAGRREVTMSYAAMTIIGEAPR